MGELRSSTAEGQRSFVAALLTFQTLVAHVAGEYALRLYLDGLFGLPDTRLAG